MEVRRAETADRQNLIVSTTDERRASVCVDMDIRRLLHWMMWQFILAIHRQTLEGCDHECELFQSVCPAYLPYGVCRSEQTGVFVTWRCSGATSPQTNR